MNCRLDVESARIPVSCRQTNGQHMVYQHRSVGLTGGHFNPCFNEARAFVTADLTPSTAGLGISLSLSAGGPPPINHLSMGLTIKPESRYSHTSSRSCFCGTNVLGSVGAERSLCKSPWAKRTCISVETLKGGGGCSPLCLCRGSKPIGADNSPFG